MTRDEIISEARTADTNLEEDALSSKYEGSNDRIMACALDSLVLRGHADKESGSITEPPFAHHALIERWVLWTTAEGFVNFYEYQSNDAAEEAFDRKVIMLDDDARTEALSETGAKVVDALARLYELNDGDEAAVGEQLYEIEKAARARYHEQEATNAAR